MEILILCLPGHSSWGADKNSRSLVCCFCIWICIQLSGLFFCGILVSNVDVSDRKSVFIEHRHKVGDPELCCGCLVCSSCFACDRSLDVKISLFSRSDRLIDDVSVSFVFLRECGIFQRIIDGHRLFFRSFPKYGHDIIPD